MSTRIRRTSMIADAGLVATLILGGSSAFALLTPTLAKGGHADQELGAANNAYLSWSQNSNAHPNHYDALEVPLSGGTPVRMNPAGTIAGTAG